MTTPPRSGTPARDAYRPDVGLRNEQERPMKHSPAPFTDHFMPPDDGARHIIRSRGCGVVAIIPDCDRVYAERADANAVLLAAAPDLLAESLANVEYLRELLHLPCMMGAAAVTKALAVKRIEATERSIARATA